MVPIQCYFGQLNQVYMNLISNAIDVMPNGGTLTIETKRTADEVIISISDTGPGISEEIQDLIFDPFFTTKEVGKGTGLGLSISYGIIQKHNGTLRVESGSQEGSTFFIHLPVDPNGSPASLS